MTTNFVFADVGVRSGAWMAYKAGKGVPTVAYSCPKCGQVGKIDPATVRADGSVSAITVCARDCGWAHAGVVLERWKPLVP